MPAGNINVNNIIAEWGNFAKNQGQRISDFVPPHMTANETDQVLTKIMTQDETVTKLSASIGPVLQSYQDMFTPNTDLSFDFHPITLARLKIDQLFVPDVFASTYLDFFTNTDDMDRKNWPFARWYFINYVWPRFEQDWERNEVWKGVKTAPTAGTVSLPGKNVDGLGIIRKRNIAAGKTSPIPVGAIPRLPNGEVDPVKFVLYVEEFIKRIDPTLLPDLGALKMSRTLAEAFAEGMEARNTTYARINQDALYTVARKGVEICKVNIKGKDFRGLSSMEGTDVIYVTTKGNDVLLEKNIGNQGIFQLESVDRQVKMFADFYKAPGIIYPRHFFTNNVELV
jgi:hypothetical protein